MPVQSETGQQAGQTKLHFSRFEFKYLLPKDLREELETQFQYFVELDPFVAGQPGSKYFVRSLYFDNDQRTHYWEKAEGLKHRKKFRLRTYTKDPRSETPQFLEIKGRHNNLVFKHRTPLAKATGSGLHGLPFPNATTHDLLARLAPGPIREQFEFDLHRRRIKPVTLVDARRRPYVSKYDPEFRMTFDDSRLHLEVLRLHARAGPGRGPRLNSPPSRPAPCSHRAMTAPLLKKPPPPPSDAHAPRDPY